MCYNIKTKYDSFTYGHMFLNWYHQDSCWYFMNELCRVHKVFTFEQMQSASQRLISHPPSPHWDIPGFTRIMISSLHYLIYDKTCLWRHQTSVMNIRSSHALCKQNLNTSHWQRSVTQSRGMFSLIAAHGVVLRSDEAGIVLGRTRARFSWSGIVTKCPSKETIRRYVCI